MILNGQSPDAIAQAVQALSAGALIGLPTETVYGLAADAHRASAVAQIFSRKGRPSTHPLIVHVAGPDDVPRFAQAVPVFAQQLIDAFWPGPLTVILPRLAGVAEVAAGGHASVGLRCPSHPVAQALLLACREAGMAGLAAPSANRFGQVSPTTAEHVREAFGDELLVLDGGACAVGIESTIVDCTRSAPVLLRPGGISRTQIEQVTGLAVLDREALATPDPQAPGTLLAHYAPKAKLRLMDAKALQTALDVLGPDAAHIAIWSRSTLTTPAKGVTVRPMPAQAAQAAQQLFATLRDFDHLGARLIWVETPPPDAAWEGVSDRLQRAAASA
ncbi:threonylcarbamoyl-AMP synthase [Comamonas serinivorans]|uniref:Threonylcarbamoyl-AMP synthase n=1 Tax=Comamonas serinivorans TaxID=1082851 RepID=A0A1Y0EIE1_9BURK|nr:L-threonylcarbamoyladenylate synthase [Comamonas serinivorans]ARU03366.1 threonylcarbamoyl-AMP synthase [Comamonas serinivorans]